MQPSRQLIDQEAILGQRQRRERVAHLGRLAVVEALQLNLKRGATSDRSVRVDVHEGERTRLSVEGTVDMTTERRAVDPAPV